VLVHRGHLILINAGRQGIARHGVRCRQSQCPWIPRLILSEVEAGGITDMEDPDEILGEDDRR
jgi:hypothetical protein